MKSLQKKIMDYISNNDLATSEFEKKAGVSGSVVYRILDNTIKNPSIDTILKIADALDCSLDELFNRHNYTKKQIFENNARTKFKSELFRSVCLHVLYYIDINRLENLNLEQVGLAIEEIYKHSIEKKINNIDIKYADWLLKTSFD
ncbi:MAG: hypothetical protein K0R02_695 [Rickettsiaceae bacterium]|jgi:transcriptional regulator with XRE-family HTH domain|nr:hypothetical protein [Rickettsiaceae bacterium]